ncbi:hypothetical protein ACI2KG_20970 [Pseudomonas sp. NPDC089407]|uniref:hypothetical protein n=1 Tax=Pseudomonas sp. NPDC089407 TaxID=3364464 RepID=UPI00384FB4D8
MSGRLDELAAPRIEGLTDANEIDLGKLGTNDFRTTIKYEGMAINDRVRVSGLGRGATGKAFDYIANFTIENKGLPDGLVVPVENQHLVNAAGGEAKNDLRKLKLNNPFTLSARVSFNGGKHFFAFKPYSLTLRQ